MMQYQLDVLKEAFPSKYDNVSLEEFNDMVRNEEIEELKNTSGEEFYKYQYFYRKNYDKMVWETQESRDKDRVFMETLEAVIPGDEIWTSQLFRDRISSSLGRPITIELRRERTSPLVTATGELKPGLEMIEYGEFKSNPTRYPDRNNLVSANPNHVFEQGHPDEPSDTDIVFYFDEQNNPQNDPGAETAYQYMKWNQQIKQNQKRENVS